MVTGPGIVPNHVIQPQQRFVLSQLFLNQCLQYQALNQPCQSQAVPAVCLEPPKINSQPQHQSEPSNLQSNLVESTVPPSQPGPVISAALTNQSCSDPAESSQ